MKGHRNTISLSVMRGIMLFLIPINVLLSAYSLFSWSVLRTQARENYSNYLSIVAQQADNELSNLFTWMRGVFYNNTYIRQIQFANNDISRFLSAQEVNQDASTYLDQYPNPMAFFIRTDEGIPIPAVSTFTQNDSNAGISQFIHHVHQISSEHTMGEYFLENIGGKWFLALLFQERGVSMGILLDVEGILNTLNFTDSQISFFSFQNTQGEVLAGIGNPDSSGIPIHSPLSIAPLSLSIIIPRENIMGAYGYLTVLSFVLAFLSVGSLVAYVSYTKQQVSVPLKKLQETIRRIEAGHTEEKLDSTGEKAEIAEVYHTFNSFIDNILHLKLEAYETRISQQHTELQYLRLQLRPHFFLNSLKRLYALAQENQMEDVQEYILCLSTHYRFLIYDTTNTISLKDEMKHVQNYLQLQQIGYHLQIHCDITMEVNPNLIRVPPLIVQSFVENSIKYAILPGKQLHISIRAKVLVHDGNTYLNLTCTDNGPGFPQKIIREIEESENEFTKKHVGFNNLMHRLALIYDEKSYIYIYNTAKGGATVDLLIPFKKIKDEFHEKGEDTCGERSYC